MTFVYPAATLMAGTYATPRQVNLTPGDQFRFAVPVPGAANAYAFHACAGCTIDRVQLSGSPTTASWQPKVAMPANGTITTPPTNPQANGAGLSILGFVGPNRVNHAMLEVTTANHLVAAFSGHTYCTNGFWCAYADTFNFTTCVLTTATMGNADGDTTIGSIGLDKAGNKFLAYSCSNSSYAPGATAMVRITTTSSTGAWPELSRARARQATACRNDGADLAWCWGRWTAPYPSTPLTFLHGPQARVAGATSIAEGQVADCARRPTHRRGHAASYRAPRAPRLLKIWWVTATRSRMHWARGSGLTPQTCGSRARTSRVRSNKATSMSRRPGGMPEDSLVVSTG